MSIQMSASKSAQWLFVAVLCGFTLYALASETSPIPTPDEMRAEIKVRGYVSEIENIDIAYVGKQIPYTYSHNKIANTPGYDWWVSKHFAIKSDLPEEKVHLYLELLEMSYPHYVSLFGKEPANIQRQRIAVVYGSSRGRVRDAMFDDGFTRGVHANAGGETMYYNRAGYSFPSHRQQHQRYIVIHETMHAFQMALNGYSNWSPNWITEGLADAIAAHVYYPEEDKLALMVLDRAPMNYLQIGLAQYAELQQPGIDDINHLASLKRGVNVLLVHFMLQSPERALRFSNYLADLRDSGVYGGQTQDVSLALLQKHFTDFALLKQEFTRFIDQLAPSFNIAYGPWEQDGNAYWIRQSEEKQRPRLDINIAPSESVAANRVYLDFPAPRSHALIGAINSGPAPSLGLLVDYHPQQLERGNVGIALGRQPLTQQEDEDFIDASYLSVDIRRGQFVHIQGHEMDAPYQAFTLNDNIRQALRQADAQLGLTFVINEDKLRITLAAGTGTALQQQIEYPLSAPLFHRLTTKPIALLASNAGHKLTPYLPQHKSSALLAAKDGASNPWNFSDYARLQRLFNFCQLQGCEDQLTPMFSAMQLASTQAAARHKLDVLEQNLVANPVPEAAASTLHGIKMEVAFHMGSPFLHLTSPGQQKWHGLLQIRDTADTLMWDNAITLVPGTNKLALGNIFPDNNQTQLQLSLRGTWHSNDVAFYASANTQEFDGVYLHSQSQQLGDKLHIATQISGPYSGDSQGKVHIEVYPSSAVQHSRQQQDVSLLPYETTEQAYSFNLAAEFSGNIHIEIKADMVVDGEDIQLSSVQQVEITRHGTF